MGTRTALRERSGGAIQRIGTGTADPTGILMYHRLALVFRERIANGDWPVGTLLPTIPELCAQFDVARVTVRRALQILAEQGLIAISRGRGTTVISSARAGIDDSLRKAVSDSLETDGDHRIELLDVEKGVRLPRELDATDDSSSYVRVRKLHYHQDQPFVIIDLYVMDKVHERFPAGSERRFKLARLLRDHGGYRNVVLREEITISHASPEMAELLDCGLGEVLVRARRWYYERTDGVIMAGLFHYRGDMFVFDLQRNFDTVNILAPFSKPGRKRGGGKS